MPFYLPFYFLTDDARHTIQELHHDAGTLEEDAEGDVYVTVPAGAHRFATVLIYLTTSGSDAGGCTWFPMRRDANGDELEVRPQAGAALLFCNVLPSGEADPSVAHAGAPALGPEPKIVMNFFVNSGPVASMQTNLKRPCGDQPKKSKKSKK